MRLPYKPNEFDVLINLFTSFGYFDNKTDNLKAIQAMSKNVKYGGKFILDFMNTKKVISELVLSEEKTVENIDFQIRRSIQNGYIVKDIRFKDKKLYHFQEKVQALTLTDFKEIFKKSGLKIMNLWGDYFLNDFNAINSPRLIILAQK